MSSEAHQNVISKLVLTNFKYAEKSIYFRTNEIEKRGRGVYTFKSVLMILAPGA